MIKTWLPYFGEIVSASTLTFRDNTHSRFFTGNSCLLKLGSPPSGSVEKLFCQSGRLTCLCVRVAAIVRAVMALHILCKSLRACKNHQAGKGDRGGNHRCQYSVLSFHNFYLSFLSVEDDGGKPGPQPDANPALNLLYSSSFIFLIWSAKAIRLSAKREPNLRRPAKSLNTIPRINKKAATRRTKNGIKNTAAPNNTPAAMGLTIRKFITFVFDSVSISVANEDVLLNILLYTLGKFF